MPVRGMPVASPPPSATGHIHRLPCRPSYPPCTTTVAGSVAGSRIRKLSQTPRNLVICDGIQAKRGEPAGIRTQDTRIKSVSGWRPWRRFGTVRLHPARGAHPWRPWGGAACHARGWQRGWQVGRQSVTTTRRGPCHLRWPAVKVCRSVNRSTSFQSTCRLSPASMGA